VTQTNATDRLLSLRETQEVLGVSRAWVTRLVRAGALPVIELGGRTLVDTADLRAFIESKKTTRTPETMRESRRHAYPRNERDPAGRPGPANTSAVPGDGHGAA
jgi:excisionase family DNA binding protein